MSENKLINVINNLGYHLVWIGLAIIAGLVSLILTTVVDFKEQFVNHRFFLVWIGLFILPLPISIFNLVYILFSRRKQEQYSSYPSREYPSSSYVKLEYNLDDIYFKAVTKPAVNENNPYFASIIFLYGPYCKVCHSDLIEIKNSITKNLKKFYCSRCEKSTTIPKYLKKDFLKQIENICKSLFRRNIRKYLNR